MAVYRSLGTGRRSAWNSGTRSGKAPLASARAQTDYGGLRGPLLHGL